MDLVIDREAFRRASDALSQQCNELEALRNSIDRTFEQLRRDWDSDAGREFFRKFESDLLVHLDAYARKFRDRSGKLTSAINMYQEVFEAADTVANAQY